MSDPVLRRVPGGERLAKGAADAYAAMVSAMRSELTGQDRALTVLSGFRSSKDQEALWKTALAKYGTPEKARKWVAPPGHSDHEKGIAVDLSGPDGTTLLIRDDEAWKWMHAHARDFGFLSYDPEPWHWAYKGSWSASWSSIPSTAKWVGAGVLAAVVVSYFLDDGDGYAE